MCFVNVPSINDLSISYKESVFSSFLIFTTSNMTYVVKGYKSIWELLPISTYDHIEKCEDNKVYFIRIFII